MEGKVFDMKNIVRGGPQRGFFGILEYLSQSNDNRETVDSKHKFKFVDDLTALEIVNLISVGMSNFNVKMSIPNDIPSHNGYIPKKNLKIQSYLHEFSARTNLKKMKLNYDF